MPARQTLAQRQVGHSLTRSRALNSRRCPEGQRTVHLPPIITIYVLRSLISPKSYFVSTQVCFRRAERSNQRPTRTFKRRWFAASDILSFSQSEHCPTAFGTRWIPNSPRACHPETSACTRAAITITSPCLLHSPKPGMQSTWD